MTTQEISQYLNALERQNHYRVEKVLKTSAHETTEVVYLQESNGAETGPFIRKTIARDSGFGNTYERIYTEQQRNTFAHIPHIIECVNCDESVVVTMEYIHGETLQDYIYRVDPSPELAGALFPDICDAVRELHEAFDPAIIHRDLKPSNVMIANGAAWLIDFGIARDYSEEASTDTTHFGTRAYAPPEQFGYGQSTVRSDIYALGMVLYFCLTEQTPTQICIEEGFADARIPQSMRNILQRATAFDPKERFASVREMKEAFLSATHAPAATPATFNAPEQSTPNYAPDPVPAASSIPAIPTAPPMPTVPTAPAAPPYQTKANSRPPGTRDARFYVGIVWNLLLGLFCIAGIVSFARQAVEKAGETTLGTYSLATLMLLCLAFLVSDKQLLREKFPHSIGTLKNWHFVIASIALVLVVALVFVLVAIIAGR